MGNISAVLAQCTDLAPLKQGGQKNVWTAMHPVHGSVVVKGGSYGSIGALERITREVSVLRDLDSEFYPKNFEFEVDILAQEFLIVEERLDAVELGSVSERYASDDDILRLLRALVSGLGVIWNRRIVHRDLKPANILITPAGAPRIVDLGIARFLDLSSVTATIAAAGPRTPIYAAPEQIRNRKAMIDVRTDFFVLGIVILELMQGYHPFDPKHVGNRAGILDNLQNGHHVNPRASDWRLQEFIRRTLRTRPVHRFRTPEQIVTLLGNGG